MLRILTVFGLIFATEAAFAAPQALNPANEKTIQWLVHDLPPAITLDSDKLEVDIEKATGPIAEMYQILSQSLPEYQHRYLRIPYIRAEKLMREHKQFCTLLLQENESRRQFLTFGEEVAVNIPPGIVMLRGTAGPKDLSPAFSVVDAVSKKDFRLGVVKGRYYSPELQGFLKTDKKSYNFVNDGSVANLFAMIGKSRLDGVLAYYFEMAEFERRHPRAPALEFVPIKEATDLSVIRASCEKTAWGEKALKSISKVVKEKKFKHLSHEFLLSVLPTERRKEYQKIYDTLPANVQLKK